jgi:hypothetical protein
MGKKQGLYIANTPCLHIQICSLLTQDLSNLRSVRSIVIILHIAVRSIATCFLVFQYYNDVSPYLEGIFYVVIWWPALW